MLLILVPWEVFVCPLDVRMGQKVILTAAGVGVLCWSAFLSTSGLQLDGWNFSEKCG